MLILKNAVTMVATWFLGPVSLVLFPLAEMPDRINVAVFANNKQKNSTSCTHMLCTSKPMTLIRCIAVCGISSGCKGVTYIAESEGICQCFLCLPPDGVGNMRLISGGTPINDCGAPPAVMNADAVYSSRKVNATVTYTCRSTYNRIAGSSSARCQDNAIWTPATLLCTRCAAPPKIERTTAIYTDTTNYTAVKYSCLDNDIYISGTTTASCVNGAWQQASILCAPTTCWFVGNRALPAYKGTANVTQSGISCNQWNSPSPSNKNPFYMDDVNFIMDGNKNNASNFCRIFNDGSPGTFCFTLKPGLLWENCAVPQCPATPGVLAV